MGCAPSTMAQNFPRSTQSGNNLKLGLVKSVPRYEGHFYKKWCFWPFFANTDPPSYKDNPFYFSKMIFFNQKDLIKIHVGHIMAIMYKSWSLLASKIDWKVSPIYWWLFEHFCCSRQTFYQIRSYYPEYFKSVGLSTKKISKSFFIFFVLATDFGTAITRVIKV